MKRPDSSALPPSRETTPGVQRGGSLPALRDVLAVAAGGAIGGTARYAFLVAFPVAAGAFPWVIFLENVVGAFLLGLVLSFVLERWRSLGTLRPFLVTGVLGSFTTFSNFAFDAAAFLGSDAFVAAVYVVASVGSGLLAAFVGLSLGVSLSRALAERRS